LLHPGGEKMPGEKEPQLEAVESVLDAMLKSENASEFCRSLVHSDFSGSATQGCQLYLLDNKSRLSAVAGYGLTPEALEQTNEELSAWDNNPVSTCVREKHHIFESAKASGKSLVCVPLLRDQLPVGVLCLVLDSNTKTLPFAESLIPILSKLGAFILATMATQKGRSGNFDPNATGEDLTSRQIQILELMAEGLVNVEIAGQLMLSESTIRQETVRIYRALGVPNRAEAAKKGKALGLIGRRTHIQSVS
jgi:DNA-binding CsgD family transcriptional regulator